MEKSRDAFRTISEVAGWLDVPTHVLRFWESRFSQIKPVKRAGGRRYYRPSDMSLIGGIKTLLHDQGMTIRGVQKMLREQGIKHVSSFSPPLHADDAPVEADETIIEGTAIPLEPRKRPVSIPAPAARATHAAEPAPEDASAPPPESDDQDQPDMFPDTDAPTEAPAPMFAHRAPAPDVEEPIAETSQTTIPDTPDVPLTDPSDDTPDYNRSERTVSLLLRTPASELRAKKGALPDVVDRLKRLHERMAE